MAAKGRRGHTPISTSTNGTANGTARAAGWRMPVQTYLPFDLGQLAEDDKFPEEQRAYYRLLAGRTVTYRSDMRTSAMNEFASGDPDRGVEMLSKVVVGWNLCDEEGNELPQPTRSNFLAVGLSDDLIATLIFGYLEVVRGPKATATA